MRRRPGVRQWIARDQASSAEAVTRLQPPSETATERAALAEGAAAEYQRDVDPAPEREVAPNSWRHPRQGKRAPGRNLAGPPRLTRLGFAAGEGNHRVLLESQGGTARRTLQQGRGWIVSDQPVGDRRRKKVGGSTGRDAFPLVAGTTTILDGGPTGLENLDHATGVKRTRSPAASAQGRSRPGSKRIRSVRPSRFQPPGLSTA